MQMNPLKWLQKKPKPSKSANKRESEGLEYLFSEGSHDFYRLPQFEMNAARRYLAYIRLVREHELGVSHSDLEIFCEQMNEHLNKGRIAQCGAMVAALQAYTELYTDNKRVYEIANCFILVDDEPIKDFSLDHSILKKTIFESSENARFFFIKSALGYLKAIIELPLDLELVDYLKSKQVSVSEKTFSASIGNNSSDTSKKI